MKKLLTALLLILITTESFPCTNLLVSRGASKDGSVMVSYAADSHTRYGTLVYMPRGPHKAGEMIEVREWGKERFLGSIPQVQYTYNVIGNMNEHQVLIGESTWGGRPEFMDTTAILDYGSLIYITLQRAKTARQAIEIFTSLADEYGYASSGESISFADKNEVWFMDIIARKPKYENGINKNKGAVWVAIRIPEGYISAHANCARITTFPKNDPENCLYSQDVVEHARECGLYEGDGSDFSFADTFCPLDFSAMRGCEARVWSFFRKHGAEDMDKYLDFARGDNPKNRMPLYVKAKEKLSVKDVADMMRDHYEGTPMDMTQDIGAGGNALPYRWRPMGFKYEGKSYMNERAIATQQTGFWFVGQSRGWLPDEIGGVNWFGCDDAATSYLTPIYTCTTEVPESFRVGNGDMITYSPTSAFWMTNRVANACYKAYNIMFPTVDAEIDAWEAAMVEAVAKADEEALALYNAASQKPVKKIRRNDKCRKVVDPYTEVRDYLTKFSVDNAQKIFEKWVALEQLLLVKYIDGNVKAQNEDGSFVTNEHTDCIPAKITQPGYTQKWKEATAKDHGTVIEVR